MWCLDVDIALSPSTQTIHRDTASSSSTQTKKSDVTSSLDDEITESDVDSTEIQLLDITSDVTLIIGGIRDGFGLVIDLLYGVNHTDDRICGHVETLVIENEWLAPSICSSSINYSPTSDVIPVVFTLQGNWNDVTFLSEIGDALNEAIDKERYSSFYDEYIQDEIILYFGLLNISTQS